MIQFFVIFILLLSHEINGAGEVAPPVYEAPADGAAARGAGFVWEFNGTICYKVKNAIEMMKIVDGHPGNIAIEFQPLAESREWFRCEKSEGRLPAWFLRSDLLKEWNVNIWGEDEQKRIYGSPWANWSEVSQIVMLCNGYDKGNHRVLLRELLGKQFPQVSAFSTFYDTRIAKVREQHQGLEIVKNWDSIEQGVSDFTHRVNQSGQQIARLEQVVEKQEAGWQHCLEKVRASEQALQAQQAALAAGEQTIRHQSETQQAGVEMIAKLTQEHELNIELLQKCKADVKTFQGDTTSKLQELGRGLQSTKDELQQLQTDVAQAAPVVSEARGLLEQIRAERANFQAEQRAKNRKLEFSCNQYFLLAGGCGRVK